MTLVPLFFPMLVGQSLMSEPGIRRDVEAGVSEVFIPQEFDDDDTPQLIVEGVLKNACFEAKDVVVRLPEKVLFQTDLKNRVKRIEFFVLASELLEPDCPPEKVAEKNVPYVLVKDLPKLEATEVPYEVWHSQKKDGPVGFLPIEKAKPPVEGSDSRPYADVESAWVEVDELHPETYILTFLIKIQNTCDEVDLEKTRIAQKLSHFIEVLPVMKRVLQSDCREEEARITRTLPIREKLKPEKYLFYVRSKGGKSLSLRADLDREKLREAARKRLEKATKR